MLFCLTQHFQIRNRWPDTTSDTNYLARLKVFTCKNLRAENMLCFFAKLPPSLSMPLMGMDFLSQFEITINYPKDEMIMVPYTDTHCKNNQFIFM